MVQQMIMNDPNIPPQLRTGLQQAVNNPAVVSQMANMMRDPSMLAHMEQAMASNPQGMMMPGMGGMPQQPFAPAAANNSTTSSNNNNNTNTSNPPRNDQAQTEEEMIAEAIRRSLEES